MNIIITIPKTVDWKDYRHELARAGSGEVMNYKVAHFPKKAKVGDRCYVMHYGYIRGWMKITGFSEKSFTCTTTGNKMSGKFIERSGKFHWINPIKHKGFQGFRYYEEK